MSLLWDFSPIVCSERKWWQLYYRLSNKIYIQFLFPMILLMQFQRILDQDYNLF